ncbi:hypothetical protein Q1695_008689 [Nippostrongylus brasiliensis]|nr:hypothetical protein Q1695_008689 [Nippostrongylus brasiliensis]
MGDKKDERTQASPSYTSTDESLPSLDKIRFDDHIVTITDPEPKKEKGRRVKKDETPPETIITSETFEIGRNSEELILIDSPRQKEKRKKRKRKQRIGTKERVAAGEQRLDTKERVAAGGVSAKALAAQVEVEDSSKAAPLESQYIRIGDRLFSREETNQLIKKLRDIGGDKRKYRSSEPSSANRSLRHDFLKEIPSRGPSREPLRFDQKPLVPRPNFNRIDSCRTSRCNSPQGTKGMPRRVNHML